MNNYYNKYRNNQSIYYRYRNNLILKEDCLLNNITNIDIKIININILINNNLEKYNNLFINNENSKLKLQLLSNISTADSIVKIILKFAVDLKLQYKYYLEKKVGCGVIFQISPTDTKIIIPYYDAVNLYIQLNGGNYYINGNFNINMDENTKLLLKYIEYSKEVFNNYYYNKSYNILYN